MNAKIKFGTQETLIQLLDSPITQIWIDCLKKWNEHSVPMKTHLRIAPFLNPVNTYKEQEVVDNINKAIEEANSFVLGEKFPYKAYLDMPWQQTNLLHRCFTTADISRKNWKHNLSLERLYKGKAKSYSEKLSFLQNNSQKDYHILDEPEFEGALHRINKWVHHYEDLRTSHRAKKFFEYCVCRSENWPFSVLEFEWDNYNENGGREWYGVSRIDYEDLKETFSNHNANLCDVYISVNITGKDYETSYFNYDDLLEYDTTNLDLVNGGLRIYNNEYIEYLYGENGEITRLTSDLGISPELVKPIPLGKIISSDVDLSSITYSDSDTYTDGTLAANGDFRAPTITLVDDKD